MNFDFKIIPDILFNNYTASLQIDLTQEFKALPEKHYEPFDFDFYLASSATYSSNIEGNSISFDTYLKYKTFGFNLKNKEVEEIEQLVLGYLFAKKNTLTLDNLLQTHFIYSKNLVPEKERGKLRKDKVGVRSNGQLIYLAVEPENVSIELTKLFDDINKLLQTELTINQVFYFASLIHLVFVYIHPFLDGNGRASRLLEKWFLASKLGIKAWNIQSEKNYFLNRSLYYKNLRLGGNYYVINYNASLPFLLMLPNSFKND